MMGASLLLFLIIGTHFCAANDISHQSESNEDESSEITSSLSAASRVESPNGVVIFFSVVLAVLVVSFILCCISSSPCCKTQKRGYILIDRQTGASSQPAMMGTPQQPATIQNMASNYAQNPVQQFPGQYQQPAISPTQYTTVQQGYQYPPIHPQPAYLPGPSQLQYQYVPPAYQDTSDMQFFNPPDPPPPYDFGAKK